MERTVARLLRWFGRNARALPWRREPREAYSVLVSELMLQQTQADRVAPRFDEFVRRFPDLEALARASEDEVVAAWSGLGYYRRARMLHSLARKVMADGGCLPDTSAGLRELPGVGAYTAAAVASMAHGEAIPVLDGNVIRVASRVLGFGGDPRRAAGRAVLMRWLDRLIAAGPPGAINEALMELGATVCVPSSPDCRSCPLATECRATLDGEVNAYPRARPRKSQIRVRWVAACCVDGRGRWLVRRITEGPILRGLWLPPMTEFARGDDPIGVARQLVPGGPATPPDVLPEVRHSITHRRIRVTPVLWRVSGGWKDRDDDRWVVPDSVHVPTSTLFHKLFKMSNLDGFELS